MFRIDAKIAVIIGGAGGLGKACALALARQGAQVVVASRNLEKLQAVTEKIQADTGSKAMAIGVDVTNEPSVTALMEQVCERLGTIDILVNAQGLNAKKPALEIDGEAWDRLFAVNVRGVMLPCKAAGKIMTANKNGKIINLSSVRGIRGTDGGNAAYGATKGAVDMITRMLAAEWSRYHVTVNAIGPGLVMTDTVKKAIAPERLKMLLKKNPAGRFATPEDVAGACAYLASPAADFVNGQILYVDGGLTAIG